MRKQLGILAVMAVMLAGMVWGATCAFQQATTTAGTASTYIRGAAVNLSVSLTGPFLVGQINATATKITVNTGTITGALISNATATNGTYFNTTVSTMALKDDTSYTFTMTVYNVSGTTLATCTQTYIPDNTQPTCVHSQSSKTAYSPAQTWTVTGVNASSATIAFGNNAAKSMSEASAGDSFSYTGTKDSVPQLIYPRVTAITNDGLNTTSCFLEYVEIDEGINVQAIAAGIVASQNGQGAKLTSAANAEAAKKQSMSVATVIIIGAAAWLLLKKRK